MVAETALIQQEAFETYCRGFANLPSATLDKCKELADAQSSKVVFAGMAEVSPLAKRLSALLAGQTAVETDIAHGLKNALDETGVIPTVQGLITEHIVDSILHSQFRPHVQLAIASLCDSVLDLYDAATYPIRRMR